MLAKTLKRAGIGFLLGIAVGNVITGLMADSELLAPALVAKAGSLSAAFLLQTLFTGLLGAVAFAGIAFYDIEDWPLLRIAVVHYLLIEAAYLPIGFFLGWFEGWGPALNWVAGCALAYAVVFLIMCIVYRVRVRELNEWNEQRKQEHRKTIGGAI